VLRGERPEGIAVNGDDGRGGHWLWIFKIWRFVSATESGASRGFVYSESFTLFKVTPLIEPVLLVQRELNRSTVPPLGAEAAVVSR
jgi:hypothetical protein